MKYEGESVLDDYLAYCILVRTSPESAREITKFIKTLSETTLIRDRISTQDLFIVTKEELLNGWIPKMKGWKKEEESEV